MEFIIHKYYFWRKSYPKKRKFMGLKCKATHTEALINLKRPTFVKHDLKVATTKERHNKSRKRDKGLSRGKDININWKSLPS